MGGDQNEVVAFLSDARSYPGLAAGRLPVERCDTHGAMIFLAGDEAWKIKRAVRLAYLDFSTLEQRGRAIRRELEINRPHAPDLYLGVVVITRRPDGRLEFGGPGEPVEWALKMRRFDQADLLSARAANGPFAADLAIQLADAVADFHASAAIAPNSSSSVQLRIVADSIAGSLAIVPSSTLREPAARFTQLVQMHLTRLAGVLAERSAAGHVRRCHGDMHLGNVVLWQGKPVLFDAIEFDEALATIDTLYDLAFLLMDLDFRGQRPAANVVLNRYLWRRNDLADVEGLAALPLFLALRAGVRAMVAGDRARQIEGAEQAAALEAAERYLRAALVHLSPPPPRLVAVGGLSGSGKSTLAAALAPGIGRAPGAVHLRSDLERKAMAGVAPGERLPAESYTAEAARAVYARLMEKAETALRAGQSVIVDAVFAKPAERGEIELMARRAGVAMDGIWLDAPGDILKSRVEARRGDASDATPEVVSRQLGYEIGSLGWRHIDSSHGAGNTLTAAEAALSLNNGSQ